MRAWRAVPVVAVLVLSSSCGGAAEVADPAPVPATEPSTTVISTTTAPSETSTTRAGATTSSRVATSTTRRGATTTTQRVTTTPGPPQTPQTGPLTTPPTVRVVDDYLPAGVPDQIFPPGTTAYQLLKEGQCGPLLRQITNGEAPTTTAWRLGGVPQTLTDLYTAAANACLANWAPARAAFSRVVTTKLCEPDPNDPTNLLPNYSSGFPTVAACQETRLRVYSWTEKLLKAHTANPAFVPNFPTPPKA